MNPTGLLLIILIVVIAGVVVFLMNQMDPFN